MRNVKKSHAIARERFLNWNNMGRPKTGHEYDMMKMSRNVFKNDLRRCRKRDNDIRNEKLAESLKNRNTSKFWAMIKSKNNNDSSTHMIDGEICNDKIADIFKEKYSAVLNNPACQTNSQVPNNDACKNYNIHVILPSDIDSAIESLNFGIGIDNIHSNHLKFCPPEFKVKLRELFNSMISHGHIPKCMLKGLAKPRIKNRFGNKHASDNYRPVMKSTNFLKMFEYCLMPAIIHNTTLHCNQFGFVRNSSTISTVTTLKEVIYRYTDNGSSVYGAFLDMSKAFDRVNFKILFDSLKGVPENIISILKHMYENQSFSVTWNGHITDECAIRNRVRQGGVISPILFNIYIDCILRKINSGDSGCRLGPFNFALIGYADGLVCLSPTISALEHLLDILHSELNDHCLTLNFDKSKVVLFSKTKKQCRDIRIGLNTIPIVDRVTYLGIVLTGNLCNNHDIMRSTQSFLRQFNAMFRKFCGLNIGIKIYLFKIYCMSFYGADAWHDLRGCSASIKGLALAYHKAIKRLNGVPYRTSNHDVCDASGLFVFDHYLSTRLLEFLFHIKRNKGSQMSYLKYYLLRRSRLLHDITLRFESRYDVTDILSNYQHAL